MTSDLIVKAKLKCFEIAKEHLPTSSFKERMQLADKIFSWLQGLSSYQQE